MGIDDVAEITGGQTQATFERRKRGVYVSTCVALGGRPLGI